MANWKPFYKYKTSQYTQRKNTQQLERLQNDKKHKPGQKGRAKK